MSVVLKYVCITCVLSANGRQKRELDSLELESWVVSYYVGTGN